MDPHPPSLSQTYPRPRTNLNTRSFSFAFLCLMGKSVAPLKRRAALYRYSSHRSLKFYSERPGPNREAAATIYLQLRKNLLSNISEQYKKTGYLWEQYSDVDGQGKGCKPFTGWSALVALIAAESY